MAFGQNAMILNGTIKNFDYESALGQKTISIFIDNLLADSEGAYITPNNNGQFAIEVSLPKPGPFILRFANMQFVLLLQPGKNLYLEFDANNPLQSLSFGGELANDHWFLKAYTQTFNKEVLDAQTKALIDEKMSWPVYNSFCERQIFKEYEFVENFKTNNHLSEAMMAYIDYEIKYQWAFRKMQYFFSSANALSDGYIELFSQYQNLNDTEALVSSKYKYFLYQNLYQTLLRTNPDAIERSRNGLTYWQIEGYDLAKKIYKGKCLEYIAARLIIDLLKEGSPEAVSIFDDYKDYATDVLILNLLEDRYKRYAQRECQIPPNTNLNIIAESDNTTFTDILNKYRGKVIYATFWSTWCHVCREHLEYARKLQSRFDSTQVVFVYFSRDNVAANWQKEISCNKIAGEHYLINTQLMNAAYMDWNFVTQPKYLLFDANGQLVSIDAPSPEDAQLEKLIRSFLP
ncbi:MAG: redoxin family protein [Chitinophagales bacterium]|nr:redoxin family protein [Chitinophagales bacterium]